MKLFYASITVVGLILLLSYSPYTGEPYPLNPDIPFQAKAAIRLANLHRFALGAVLIGLSIIGLVRESKISRMRKMTEREAALTGDLTMRSGGSEAWEAPPPYMKFFYASTIAAGLFLLLAWSPYSYPYDPLSPFIANDGGVADIEFANLQRFALSAGFIGLSVIGLVRESKISRMRKIVEPAASPNGGPAMPLGTAGVMEGPPSVS